MADHQGAPTGAHDRENYIACQCDCACDADPGRSRLCAECRRGEHVECYPGCPAPGPHFGPDGKRNRP